MKDKQQYDFAIHCLGALTGIALLHVLLVQPRKLDSTYC